MLRDIDIKIVEDINMSGGMGKNKYQSKPEKVKSKVILLKCIL